MDELTSPTEKAGCAAADRGVHGLAEGVELIAERVPAATAAVRPVFGATGIAAEE